ncbi:hypothetical protein CLOM_g22746 [Closterium sp. NIES-68]|nr:hypothetical protein CLOM_g22746 [Closterium sp. NIES-68]GJP60558.1 hypothetical protein CLOP_g17799 [Closterium sp. NIES-67]
MADRAVALPPAAAAAGCACACHGEWSAAVVALRQLEEWQGRAAQYIALLENEKAAADAQVAQLQETRATEARAWEERVRVAEGAVAHMEEERRKEGERVEEERRREGERVREQAERIARLREVHLQTRLGLQQQEMIRRDRAAMEIHAFWQEAVRERNEALMGTKQAQRELRSRDQADKEKAEVTKALMRQCEECRKEKDSALLALAGVKKENEALEVNLQRQGKVIERLIDLNSELVEGNEALQHRQRELEGRAAEMGAEVQALRRRVGDVAGGGERGDSDGEGERQQEGREQQEGRQVEGVDGEEGRGQHWRRDEQGSSRSVVRSEGAGGGGTDESSGGGGLGVTESGRGEAGEEDGEDGPVPVSSFPTEQPTSLQSHAAASLGESQQTSPSFFAFFSSKPAAVAAAAPMAPPSETPIAHHGAGSPPPGPINPAAASARVLSSSSGEAPVAVSTGSESVEQRGGGAGGGAREERTAGECEREHVDGREGGDREGVRNGGGEWAREQAAASTSQQQQQQLASGCPSIDRGSGESSDNCTSTQAPSAATPAVTAAAIALPPHAAAAAGSGNDRDEMLPAGATIGEDRDAGCEPHSDQARTALESPATQNELDVQHARDTGFMADKDRLDRASQSNGQKRLGAAWSAVRGNAKGLFSYIVGADKVSVGS